MSIEVRVIKVDRYAVTYHSSETGCSEVATNLTLEQAQNIAGAVHARAEAAGMVTAPLKPLQD